MPSHRLQLVSEVLVLLRQVRAEVAGVSNRVLIDSLDKAIAILESSAMSGARCSTEVLNALSNGLAAIPAIARIISGLKDQ
jgi:hypothetical protein